MVLIVVAIASLSADTNFVETLKKLVEIGRRFRCLESLWLMPTFQLWDVGIGELFDGFK